MSDKTISESLFELFCEREGVLCNKIFENNKARVPDYEIQVLGQKIIVEVKEIVSNESEKKSQEELLSKSAISVNAGEPGNRVRK